MGCITTRKPALDEGLDPRKIKQPSVLPPHPMNASQAFILSRVLESGFVVMFCDPL